MIESLLFGVDSTDFGTFAAVAATLLTVAFIACFLPARRAARIDPVICLRDG